MTTPSRNRTWYAYAVGAGPKLLVGAFAHIEERDVAYRRDIASVALDVDEALLGTVSAPTQAAAVKAAEHNDWVDVRDAVGYSTVQQRPAFS